MPECSVTYRVKRGDTMSSIARDHNVTLAALLAANPGIVRPDLIDVDDEVTIPATKTAPPPPAPLVAERVPLIVPRSEWGAKPPRAALSSIGTVRGIVVHHTGAPVLPKTKTEGIAEVKRTQAFHQDNRRWADLGYNLLLAQDGTWYVGRAHHRPEADPLKGLAAGAHTSNHNIGQVGLCVMGFFHAPHSHRMSEAATRALRAMVDALRARYGPLPIKGHREMPGASTACPGDLLMPIVQALPGYAR